MKQLEQEFEQELQRKMRTAKNECKYNPTYFNQMLAEYGGVGTTKRLIQKGITTGNPSDGYTTLLLMGRLDLTMEDSVVEDKYKAMFEQTEVEYCRKLLGR
ncbi:hypothetical protein [Marasmitruncus massiliensis]|uniref:hypothetical protein n=1 Tax=Marasmitruncus massiliensis TaxID=1944642 RepID=UPI000C7DFB69|nr:hypothetical protein [Marasmitruncus massiliensis]